MEKDVTNKSSLPYRAAVCAPLLHTDWASSAKVNKQSMGDNDRIYSLSSFIILIFKTRLCLDIT